MPGTLAKADIINTIQRENGSFESPENQSPDTCKRRFHGLLFGKSGGSVLTNISFEINRRSVSMRSECPRVHGVL
jgi:hypothetical protein